MTRRIKDAEIELVLRDLVEDTTLSADERNTAQTSSGCKLFREVAIEAIQESRKNRFDQPWPTHAQRRVVIVVKHCLLLSSIAAACVIAVGLWAERSQSTAKVRVLDHVDAALNVWDYKLAFGLLGNRADWPIADLPDYESRQKTAEMMQAFLTGQSEKLMHICHAIPSPSRQQLQLAEYASQGESIPPLEIASIVKSPMSSPDHAEVRESGDQSGWAQYVVGLRQLAANQNHDALVTFGRIVTVYPRHAQALACRGIAAFRLRHDGSDGERYQEMAMHDISAALEIDPKNAGLLRCHTQLVEAMDNDNNATH